MANRNLVFSLVCVACFLIGLIGGPSGLAAQNTVASSDGVSQAHSVERGRALIEKGRKLLKRGGTEAACISFRRATMVLPTWWIARFEYVRCARLLGAPFEELVDHLGIALNADPTKPALYHLLGVVHEDYGRKELARNAYRKAVELAPWMVEVHLRIGLLSLDEKSVKSAESAFESVLKHDPANLIARNHLADLYIETGRPRQAIPHLQFVLNVTRYPGPTLARLARLYGNLGMKAERQKTLRRFNSP